MTDWQNVKVYRCRWCGRRVWFHNPDKCKERPATCTCVEGYCDIHGYDAEDLERSVR